MREGGHQSAAAQAAESVPALQALIHIASAVLSFLLGMPRTGEVSTTASMMVRDTFE